MATRRRPPENINRRLKERDSTLPDLDAPRSDSPADPRKAAGGPPLKPFVLFGKASKATFDALRPYLVTSMSDQQRREDAAEAWAGAERYIFRTATLMKREAARHDQFPFHGDDLLTRFTNLQEVGLAAQEQQQRADYLKDTYTAAQADLLRMCDFVNLENEAQMNRPLLPRAERSARRDEVALALQSWHERLDRIRQSSREREAVTDDYRVRLEAAEAARGEEQAPVASAAPQPKRTAKLAPAPAAPPRRPAPRGRGTRR